jgi:hypothetical protein
MKSQELIGYEAISNATTTELMFMPEFVAVGVRLLNAYRDYYLTDESLQISQAMFELGNLAQAHGVHFDIEKLIQTLAEEMS